MKTIICCHCDLVSEKSDIKTGYVAKCARCNQPIYSAGPIKVNKMLALSVTALLFCFPAFSLPLISVHLLGVTEQTDLLQGALLMVDSEPLVAFVVIFCAVIAPTLLSLSMFYSNVCLALGKRPSMLSPILKLTSILIHWSMLEVYLVSFMVAIFKLSSYADIYYDAGIYFLVALLIVNMTMISEYDNEKYWDYLYNE
jgi:paraquat-inducible protein A